MIINDSQNINIQNNNWWSLIPNETNGSIYFEGKLHSINVGSTSTYINFDIKILIRCKSTLPKNLIVGSFSIPEYSLVDIPLSPIIDEANDNEWTTYNMYLEIPKNKLSYIHENLKDLVIPININFACNQQVLSEIQNQFDSLALKNFLDNLYDTIIKANVNLDTFFSFTTNYGNKYLYDIFPSSIDSEGIKFLFSWNSKQYLRLQRDEMIDELLTITTSIPLTISNLKISFYYHIPNQNGYKFLEHSENKNYSINKNQSFVFQMPFKVVYDETKHELTKDVIAGHDFLLPYGGNGYYEINFNIQTENAFYKIMATNNFNYFLPMNELETLDFFVFNYYCINTLNGFNKVT